MPGPVIHRPASPQPSSHKLCGRFLGKPHWCQGLLPCPEYHWCPAGHTFTCHISQETPFISQDWAPAPGHPRALPSLIFPGWASIVDPPGTRSHPITTCREAIARASQGLEPSPGDQSATWWQADYIAPHITEEAEMQTHRNNHVLWMWNLPFLAWHASSTTAARRLTGMHRLPTWSSSQHCSWSGSPVTAKRGQSRAYARGIKWSYLTLHHPSRSRRPDWKVRRHAGDSYCAVGLKVLRGRVASRRICSHAASRTAIWTFSP